ncbi:MAG: sigma-E factor negative regulatory protein [Pseudomonadota bacterium]
MDAKEIMRENISSLVDGELENQQLDIILLALENDEYANIWNAYHQIGDALRSDELAFTLSSDFSTRMSARLALEPELTNIESEVSARVNNVRLISDAGALKHGVISLGLAGRQRWGTAKKISIVGATATATAVAAMYFAGSQLMVASNGSSTRKQTEIINASTVSALSERNDPTTARNRNLSIIQSPSTTQGAIMLRDPGIDDYLLAHQRVSPSIYSTAQYARSATFSSDSEK